MINLERQRYIREQMQQTQALVQNLTRDFQTQLDELTWKHFKSLEAQPTQLSDDLQGMDAKVLLISCLLLRYTSHWLNKLGGIKFKSESHNFRLEPFQVESFSTNLLQLYMKEDRAENDLFIKDMAEKFLNQLKDSKLFQVTAEKATENRAEFRRVSDYHSEQIRKEPKDTTPNA